MKICMILGHDFLHPHIDPRPYKEAKGLIRKGHDVTIVCWAVDFTGVGKDLKGLPRTEVFENIKIVRIFQRLSTPRSTSLIRGFQQLIAMIKMGRKAVEFDPQIIHCHDLDTLLSGVVAKKRIKVPLIYDSHEDWPGMIAPRGVIKSKLSYIFEILLIKYVDYTITVSSELVNMFKIKGQNHIAAIYNSRLLSDSIEEDMSMDLKKKFDINDDDFIVGYVGALSDNRGIDYLIKSVKLVKTSKKNIKLLIIGGPEIEIENLRFIAEKEGASEKVIFTGHVPYCDIPSYLALLDVGTSLIQPEPNHSIAAPGKIFEYMRMKLPMIVSDLKEMEHIVIENNCGITVDPTNPNEIAKAIEFYLENPIELNLRGERGRLAYENKYSWEKMEEKLISVYEELICV
ncbi:glycosyltransferase family 4 protein [Candidatus Methanocrinis natronophilus]|uniref:Glycosyltransferase family 4 protein n=1 Tax=Candidatus Methanocrinis natronophilus TaxID=3033396 RepID=A0ABT5X9M0_9EURY|nr:glycosyltransferase family 4 protein [Candidatus Methanocrinis natronophilus]MDF0591410.1 glycosyltransferase family 4 protein [Candidatus Methanocrinis natronophilus]